MRRVFSSSSENSVRMLHACLIFLAIFFLYSLAGKIGLSFAFLHSSVSAFWPPTGIAIIALLFAGLRYWPAIFLGAFFFNSMTGTPLPVALGIALGNTGEALLIAFLLITYCRGLRVFDSPRTLFLFLLSALIGCTVSASVGVFSLSVGHLVGWSHYSTLWFTWLMGDFIGALIFVPFGIALAVLLHGQSVRRHTLEKISALLFCLFISALVFSPWSPLALAHYPLPFLCILPLLWVSLRFGLVGTGIFIVLLSFTAVYGTVSGFGPFAVYPPNGALLFLQLYLGIISFLGLLISSTTRKFL